MYQFARCRCCPLRAVVGAACAWLVAVPPRESYRRNQKHDRNGDPVQYLTYSGVPLLTSDAAADATLAYCSALAQSRLADVVRVPSIDSDGVPIRVGMVLGPAIPVLAVPAPDDVLESDDDVFVRDLEMRTAAVQQGLFAHRE